MKAGGGHAKGASFEREVAKRLSKWISKDETDALLWRSAMSGGRATLQRRKGVMNQKQAGDLSAISADGERFLDSFLIECKFYKNLQLASGILFDKGDLFAFWRKLSEEARDRDREPMLIVKQNLIVPLVLLRHRGAALLYLRQPLVWAIKESDATSFGVWTFEHLLSHPYRINDGRPPKRKIVRERLSA